MKTASLTHPIQTDNALQLYRLPFVELLHRAHCIHREFHDVSNIQKCFLLSIKTGGCPENCGYCSQSAHHQTGVVRQPLLTVQEVVRAATDAKHAGAHRFCMGAGWRHAPEGEQFERVLEMVGQVKALDMEACVTLGMLTRSQADRLKAAGLDAYNHNLDTSREHYPNIVTTRTYDDRLETLRSARLAGLTLCSGGILGMGESEQDRCALIAELASLDPQPESVPINMLVPVPGTPLSNCPPASSLDLIRTVAVARILMPRARIRLAAGRLQLSQEAQTLAIFGGVNSIFIGNRLLTTPNAEPSADEVSLAALQGEDFREAGLGLDDAPELNVGERVTNATR
jgi:biotin synthase